MTNPPRPGTRPGDSHAHLRRSLGALAESTHRRARAITRASGPGGGRTGPDEGDVDGIGVTLLVGTESVFVGANPFTNALDQVQYGLGEGPCLSAVAARRTVRSTRIGAGERRWSRFTPRAVELGLRSVSSAPLVSGADVVGSLNIYSRAAHGLEALSPAVLRELADAAESALAGAHLLAPVDAGARHLADALEDRGVVERAVGVLMDRYTTNANQARTLLAQLARQDDTTEAAAARILTDAGPGPEAGHGGGFPDDAGADPAIDLDGNA